MRTEYSWRRTLSWESLEQHCSAEFCSVMEIFYNPLFTVWWPLATCDCWVLGMWLVWLKNWISNSYFLNLSNCCFANAYSQRRQWHPTPVLLPGKSHGQRSLVGCSPWGSEESDMTEQLHFHFSLLCIGEGNGNPLRCSCLKIPGMGSHRVEHDWSDLAVAMPIVLIGKHRSRV